MSPYDLTPDDEPLDMTAVACDDELVEGLRRSLSPQDAVVWDDDEDDVDLAFALLRALQTDVAAGLPDAPVLPAGVTPLAGRRRLSRGATVAAIAAGVLSIGGVAAASAPGQPLAGVRSAVSSAVGSMVDAITPDTPVGPAVAEPSKSAKPTDKPSAKPTATPPGAAVSAAARAAAAAKQVDADLDRAAVLLDRGAYTAAEGALDSAARKLPLVTETATHDALAARLSALRARLDAPRPEPTKSAGRPEDKGKPTAKPTAKPDNSGQGSTTRSTRAPAPKVKVPVVHHTAAGKSS